ncbi:unnamed protein product [Arctia plantaginis]|uniref:Uncharacterized protein n=1 Tax=Arctia plantaginis TaxID=874455 RepID=A0A8S1A3T7_ARCPL|nr:unnamed protein product [Arctia plantaginis]
MPAVFRIEPTTLGFAYALSQTISAPSNINNGIPNSYGPAGLGTASLAAANIGSGLAGQMMANGIPAAAFGPMGPQALGIPQNQMGIAQNQMGIPQNQMGIAQNQMGIAQNQMGIAQNQMGIPQNHMGVPAAVAANNFGVGYIGSYGGSGSGDVAVAGELPVAGTTAITGQVPMSADFSAKKNTYAYNRWRSEDFILDCKAKYLGICVDASPNCV